MKAKPTKHGLKTTREPTRQTAHLLLGNDHGQGFKPGQTGNPGGRPKGLAALVREKTKDGHELVQIMQSIAHGKLGIKGRPPSHRDRIQAVEWLADRGFGSSPKVEVTVNNTATVDTSKPVEQLTIPELRSRLEALRLAANDADSDGAGS